MWDKLALILLVIGGVNWGLVGIFEFDLVAWLFGGATSALSRIVYILVAISAVWCISFLFRREALAEICKAPKIPHRIKGSTVAVFPLFCFSGDLHILHQKHEKFAMRKRRWNDAANTENRCRISG